MIAERWAAFTRRIEHLAKIADGGLGGAYGAAKHMRGNCAAVVVDLKQFALEQAAVLPDAARPLFQNRLDAIRKMLEDESSQGLNERVQTALGDLRSLAVEVDYHLADFQAPLRSLAERAFEHLQRSIVADDDIKRKWQQALARSRAGETSCEALGAVHLLSHGIWAFKAGVRGAVTDLVYQDQAIDIRRVEKAAVGLVLTEWKVARTDGDKEFREAEWQAHEYAGGALAALMHGDELLAA